MLNKVDLSYTRLTFWKYLCEMLIVTQLTSIMEPKPPAEGLHDIFLPKVSWHTFQHVCCSQQKKPLNYQESRLLELQWGTSHYSRPMLRDQRWHPVKSGIFLHIYFQPILDLPMFHYRQLWTSLYRFVPFGLLKPLVTFRLAVSALRFFKRADKNWILSLLSELSPFSCIN